MLIKWWQRLFLKLRFSKTAQVCGQNYKSKRMGNYIYYIKEDVCQRCK